MSALASLQLLFADIDASRNAGRDADGVPRAARARHAPEDDAAARASPDHALIDALRSGDERVFEALFRQHYLALRRFAQLLVHTDDAGDVVEDVFAWLWSTRASLDVHGSLASYLYSAVRHRALNAIRNQRRRVDLHQRFPGDVSAISDETAEMGADEEELLTRVRAVIAALPERRRLAITLRWESGLSNAEIAGILGIAPQSVANLLQRAMHDVRAAFPEHFR